MSHGDGVHDPASAYHRAPSGLATITKQGKILLANQTLLDWFGADDADDLPPFSSMLRVGDRIFWETHLAPLLDLQGRVNEIAVELMTPSGPMPALLNAISEAPGAPSSIDVAIFSAKDRRSYEQELLAERRIAEDAEARARELAETLQQSLIPPSLPSIPGLELSAAYRPAGDGAQIGGDWYEVFQINPSSWLLSIGDVVGKGASAASLTAFVRYTIRGASMETTDLAQVLRDVNRAMVLERTDRTATVCLVRIDLHDVDPVLTVASAGHPLPRLTSSDGEVTVVGETGPLLGIFEDPSYLRTTLELEPGATVLMFTDGLTEARRDEEFYGENRVHGFLSANNDVPVAELAKMLESEAVGFQRGTTRDDIAVVFVRRQFAPRSLDVGAVAPS